MLESQASLPCKMIKLAQMGVAGGPGEVGERPPSWASALDGVLQDLRHPAARSDPGWSELAAPAPRSKPTSAGSPVEGHNQRGSTSASGLACPRIRQGWRG
jgi:hypothetical protein